MKCHSNIVTWLTCSNLPFGWKPHQLQYNLINRLPSTLNKVSPFEKLFCHPSNYSMLHVFGYVCFVHPPHERSKLSCRAVVCAFVGYIVVFKWFLCFDPKLRHFVSLEMLWFLNIFHSYFLLLNLSKLISVHDVQNHLLPIEEISSLDAIQPIQN